ncbi:hemolysin E, partial [Escherichia coli]|uniref:hemolysin E n=1 Tax=Escherichia coli TaxID=562 RepID=UPI00203B1043
MTEIVADKTVEVVKNAIETADGALDLYNKYLDQVIPWQTFDETIKELSRFKQEYSQAASVLVGDIKTLLMDSQDKYFEATQTVYEWCGVVNRPGFPGECFICELRLPDHRFRWKHNKLFLLLP